MTDTDLIVRLAGHRSLGVAPAHEREWLAAHGTLRALPPGEVVSPRGQSVTSLYIVLSGALAIHIDRGAGSHKLFEWHGGDVAGLLPYSRGARAPNDAITEEATEILFIPSTDFPALIRECPVATATMVHAMLDRARSFSSADLRDEKLVSLGRLAAGLAHELNNPASAAVRSAKLLAGSLAAADTAATAVGAAGLTDAQWQAIHKARALCSAPAAAAWRSPVVRADREDAISAWLAAHGVTETCADPLVDTALTTDALDALAAAVGAEALDATLRWVAAGCTARTLAAEIETATSRIHDLVASIKGFTFMDHAPTPEPVDIRRGIADTLTMLAGKTRAKSAEVSVEIPQDLPHAYAVGAELNQVWMNLLDNALDAVLVGGHVTVAATAERDQVVVRIIDDGAGIPPELMGRIFDPFFTTKDVGSGTGLGLDIVRRILKRHGSEVNADSRPGRTEFRVSLPVAG